jgi:hypothetical protein
MIPQPLSYFLVSQISRPLIGNSLKSEQCNLSLLADADTVPDYPDMVT